MSFCLTQKRLQLLGAVQACGYTFGIDRTLGAWATSATFRVTIPRRTRR